MENTLYRYNEWWENIHRPNYIQREELLESLVELLGKWQLIYLTGLRGIGKTTLMKLVIKKLINDHKINPKRILFASMDDYLLSHFSLPEIVDEYRKIHQIRYNEPVYLFFDEVEHKPDFESQFQKIMATQNVKIVASISGVSLSKSRKESSLLECTVFEILPLDFEDYLNFKKIRISKTNQHLLPAYFEDFLRTGGIPKYVISGDEDYVRELVDDIIYKEIAIPHGIKNIQILKDYFMFLMDRATKIFSINQIASLLEISPDSSKRYLEMFTDTFLVYTVNRFGGKTKENLTSRKIYACDPGILNLFTEFRDVESLFENYVYLKIKNLKPSYIYSNTMDIDFLTANNHLIDTKYNKEELLPKQKKLFDEFKAEKKFILRNYYDLTNYLKGLS
jgi:uncharacterized protein